VINDAGLSLIKKFEGCRLESYKDAVGVWTIGYGHTTAAGPPEVKPGMRISQAEANLILVQDLDKFEGYVRKYLTRNVSENAFAACVSFCYNVGPKNFAKSSVLKSINAGNMDEAARRLMLWNKAGGKVLNGLTRRRAAEAALMLTPDGVADPATVDTVESTTTPQPPAGKPVMASTTNIAAGGAGVAGVAGGIAAASDIASSAAGAAASVRTIWDTLGVVAPIVAGIVVVICAGWIIYQRVVKSKEDGV
jgi:lysozyme